MIRFSMAAALLFALQLGLANAESKTASSSAGSFHDLSAKTIDGKTVKMSEYKGKVVLVVNTASKCGYTPQYEGLQKLHDANKDKGFVVLGFPSNDFGGQEPGADTDIKSFCKLNYGVNFPLFSKNPVVGKEKQPVYKYLTESAPEPMRGEVDWNFEKFLINGQGQIVGRYKSKVAPNGDEIAKAIAENLPQAKKQ